MPAGVDFSVEGELMMIEILFKGSGVHQDAAIVKRSYIHFTDFCLGISTLVFPCLQNIYMRLCRALQLCAPLAT